MNELVEYLKRIASREANSDDGGFCVDDIAGGNVDDAFWAGKEEGETLLARYLLTLCEPT